MSIGYAGLEKFCSIMDLPKPMSRFAHKKSLVNVETAARNLATIYMKKAAEKLIELLKREEPYNINELDDGTEIANIAITIDGTSTPKYKKSLSSRGKKESKIQEEERTKLLRRRQLIHVETDDNNYSIEPRIQFVLPLTDTFTVIYK